MAETRVQIICQVKQILSSVSLHCMGQCFASMFLICAESRLLNDKGLTILCSHITCQLHSTQLQKITLYICVHTGTNKY